MGRKENIVESYLQSEVKRLGGFTRKVTYQGRAGAPDQWNFFSDARLLIVECKAEDGVVDALQQNEINTLRRSNFQVHIVYTKQQVDELLERFLRVNEYRIKTTAAL